MNILHWLPWLRSREPFVAKLSDVLGFRPLKIAYYELAFRHSSQSVVDANGFRLNNERLEFLGDSVLATAMSHYLYDKHPLWDEGLMSQRRGALVKRAVNNSIAEEMGLGQLINARQQLDRLSPDVYGNALEALIGAIFLDRGYKYAERFVYQRFVPVFKSLEEELSAQTTNYKSELLEWVQKNHLQLEYGMKPYTRSGRTNFECLVYINGAQIGSGRGSSKKEAQQAASHNALEVLRQADAEIAKEKQGRQRQIERRRRSRKPTSPPIASDTTAAVGRDTVEVFE